MGDEKNKYRDVAMIAAAAGSSVGAAVMGAVLLGVDEFSDPLRDALQPSKIANIRPDQLADEISKDPLKQARWKELREFVAKIDAQVGENLEQGAGGSQDVAKHWKDHVPSANAGKQADKARLGAPSDDDSRFNRLF